MTEDIEKYHAEMIPTRNTKKDISRNEYKKHHVHKWNKTVNASELQKIFGAF